MPQSLYVMRKNPSLPKVKWECPFQSHPQSNLGASSMSALTTKTRSSVRRWPEIGSNEGWKMIAAYRIQAEQLAQSEMSEANVLVYCQPSNAEKDQLLREFSLDPLDLEAINDPDEVPRIETSQDGLLIIWNWPDNVSCGDTIQFEVSTIGLFLGRGKAVAIVPRGQLPVTGREFKRLTSVEDFVLRVLLYTVHQYQGHLKAIKMKSTELESKVVTSMPWKPTQQSSPSSVERSTN
jgi:hypothetical protein